MKHFCAKCIYIMILQFVLMAAGLANTLTVDEAGNVLAETDRYQARFENGVAGALPQQTHQRDVYIAAERRFV